jgi:hypothetical protein
MANVYKNTGSRPAAASHHIADHCDADFRGNRGAKIAYNATLSHCSGKEDRTAMRAVSIYATAVVTAVMLAPWMGASAQDSKLSVPNVTVTAPAAPVEPPYMRDPWKAYSRNPYFGRYRVEEDKFSEVPCTQTRIAFSQGGRCLQGYRRGVAGGGTTSQFGSSSPCDMGLDVVIDTVEKLAIEADILGFDPYKV